MTAENPTIYFPNLTDLERLDLEAQVGSNNVTFEEQTLDSDSHGELLTTTAIVVISLAAIRGISAWLLRTSHKGKIRRKIKVYNPTTGQIREEEFEMDINDSQAPKADVLKALAEKLGIDPQLLATDE